VAELTWVAVTDVAKIVNPGEGLMRWANKVGREGKTIEEARKTGTFGGRLVHKCAERLAAGDDPVTVRAQGPSAWPVRGHVGALCQWWEDTAPDVKAVELNVSGDEHRCRGRIDFLRACDLPECCCYGEGVVVTDFKAQGHTLYREQHLQGGGYALLWPLSGHEPRHLCRVEFVTLCATSLDSEPYRVQPCLATPEDFASALDLWRRMDRLLQVIREPPVVVPR
jgi:hypothetical protein